MWIYGTKKLAQRSDSEISVNIASNDMQLRHWYSYMYLYHSHTNESFDKNNSGMHHITYIQMLILCLWIIFPFTSMQACAETLSDQVKMLYIFICEILTCYKNTLHPYPKMSKTPSLCKKQKKMSKTEINVIYCKKSFRVYIHLIHFLVLLQTFLDFDYFRLSLYI